jgi:hypothetical protein
MRRGVRHESGRERATGAAAKIRHERRVARDVFAHRVTEHARIEAK